MKVRTIIFIAAWGAVACAGLQSQELVLGGGLKSIQTIRFTCTGNGVSTANGSKVVYADELSYRASGGNFIYTYKFSNKAQDGGVLMPHRTVAFNSELFQVVLHEEKLMQISKSAGAEARNYRYVSTNNLGLFEPYAFLSAAYHSHLVKQKDAAHLKFTKPASMGFYPQLADFITSAQWMAKGVYAKESWLPEKTGKEEQIFRVPGLSDQGRAAVMRVHFSADYPKLSNRWEMFYEGEPHPFLVWQADLRSFQETGDFCYFARFEKRAYLQTGTPDKPPLQISKSDYKVVECTINEAIEEGEFTVDPSVVKLIQDLDSNKWILVPK